MKQAIQVTHPSEVMVSDRVTFARHNRDYFGYVAKKGRKYAYVVCDDSSECKVPYPLLSKIPGAQKQQVRMQVEKLRLQYHVNDRVEFVFKRRKRLGIITRLNPRRAHVVCENDQEFQVPYEILTIKSSDHSSSGIRRNERALEAIARRAQRLLTRHRLAQWSFQFDHGTRRAGSCQYDKCVISMSYDYAKHASDEDVQDTILHEIAHALVGKKHNHDAVWRAKALEIGCSGNRCHDVQFTPPRYIMKCERGCWVATVERRRRNVVCKQCGGKIFYTTYTDERWKQASGRP